ncbi:hypothetical protein V6N13_096825 [Hibiscus sabdariffa]
MQRCHNNHITTLKNPTRDSCPDATELSNMAMEFFKRIFSSNTVLLELDGNAKSSSFLQRLRTVIPPNQGSARYRIGWNLSKDRLFTVRYAYMARKNIASDLEDKVWPAIASFRDRPLGHHHVSLCFAPLLDNPDDNGDVVQEPVAKFSVPSVPNVELAPRGSLPITAKGKAVLQLKTKVSHRLLSHIRVLLQTLVPNLNRIHRPPSSGHLLAFSMQLARNMLLFLMIGGCGHPKFLTAACQFLCDARMNIIGFNEPCINGRFLDVVIYALYFPHSYRIECDGFSTVLLSMVCASPNVSKRRNLWPSLMQIASSITSPWILLGDFNTTLSNFETQGGANSVRPCKLIQQFLYTTGFRDLGFHAPHFTWNCGSTYACFDNYM